MLSGVLALKLTLAPGLVAAATATARRLGHRAGGLVGGLPVVAAPIVLIYAVEHGEHFATTAARNTVLGIVSLVAFCAVYALAAERAPWPGAVVAGWAAFLALTALFAAVRLPLGAGILLNAVAIAATWSLLERLPRRRAGTGRDLLALRLVVTAAMVVALTALAGPLSARVSGLLAPFPIITAVLAGFTHAQAGGTAAVQMLEGLVPGLVSFVLFFVIVGLTLPGLGTAGAFAVATLAALASHAVLAAILTRRGADAPVREPATSGTSA